MLIDQSSLYSLSLLLTNLHGNPFMPLILNIFQVIIVVSTFCISCLFLVYLVPLFAIFAVSLAVTASPHTIYSPVFKHGRMR
jgi:hypothetical protein